MERTELVELRLQLAAAERQAERAERDWEVQPWSQKAAEKRDAARRKVWKLAHRLMEREGQGMLTL